MNLQIVDAERGRHYKDFIKLPWKVYRNDPYWIPPLRKEVSELLSLKHPFYRHAERKLFLCLKDGVPAGRIAAIINHRHNEFHRENAGFFGFFEAVRDPSVFQALLEAAEGWLKDNGMAFCRGPVNPSTNEECGMLVENFVSPPFVMMTFNPPYYPEMMERAGYSKEKDLFAYFFDAGGGIPERLEKLTRRIRKREKDLVVRPLDMSRFKEELKVVRTVYNEAWEKNWGFVPMTDDELDHMAGKLKSLVVPDMVSFAFIGNE
ncbi:N-acetyltransferase, partial [bacterium]